MQKLRLRETKSPAPESFSWQMVEVGLDPALPDLQGLCSSPGSSASLKSPCQPWRCSEGVHRGALTLITRHLVDSICISFSVCVRGKKDSMYFMVDILIFLFASVIQNFPFIELSSKRLRPFTNNVGWIINNIGNTTTQPKWCTWVY